MLRNDRRRLLLGGALLGVEQPSTQPSVQLSAENRAGINHVPKSAHLSHPIEPHRTPPGSPGLVPLAWYPRTHNLTLSDSHIRHENDNIPAICGKRTGSTNEHWVGTTKIDPDRNTDRNTVQTTDRNPDRITQKKGATTIPSAMMIQERVRIPKAPGPLSPDLTRCQGVARPRPNTDSTKPHADSLPVQPRLHSANLTPASLPAAPDPLNPSEPSPSEPNPSALNLSPHRPSPHHSRPRAPNPLQILQHYWGHLLPIDAPTKRAQPSTMAGILLCITSNSPTQPKPLQIL